MIQACGVLVVLDGNNCVPQISLWIKPTNKQNKWLGKYTNIPPGKGSSITYLSCISALTKALTAQRALFTTLCIVGSLWKLNNGAKLAIYGEGTQQSNLAASEWPSTRFASFHLIQLCNRLLEVPPGSSFIWQKGFVSLDFNALLCYLLSKGMLCKEWIRNRNGCHASPIEPVSKILVNNLVGHQAHE